VGVGKRLKHPKSRQGTVLYVKHSAKAKSKRKTKAGLTSAYSLSRSPQSITGFLLENKPKAAGNKDFCEHTIRRQSKHNGLL